MFEAYAAKQMAAVAKTEEENAPEGEDKEEAADDSSAEGGEDAATVGLGGRKASNSNFRALLEADAARAKEMKQVCDLRFAVQLLYIDVILSTPSSRSCADAQDWLARRRGRGGGGRRARAWSG